MTRVIYAGSFDPITNGHIWVILEAARLFKEVLIVLANNPTKKYYLTIEQRKKLIRTLFPQKNIKVVVLENEYVAQYAQNNGIEYLIRGLRNQQDFEFEKTVQTLNQLVVKDIKTIYVLPPAQYSEISSSNVKNMVGFPGWMMAIESLVPHEVTSLFQQKIYESKLRPWWDLLEVNDEESFQDLLQSYSQPGRYYHTLEHLDELFSNLTKVTTQPSKEMILSIFFHDYIYIAQEHNNEELSEKAFINFANKNKLPIDLIQQVSEFILATKTHQNKIQDPELDLFLDLDLSILGTADSARFNRYEQEIRKEYSFVPEEAYLSARGRIMKKLSSQDYSTKIAQTLWSKNKKENLKRYQVS